MLLGAPTARAASGTVNVFYAGSLVNVNENLVGPAFGAATGYSYQGKGAGSLAIVNQIKGKIATSSVALAWPIAANSEGNRKIARNDGSFTNM